MQSDEANLGMIAVGVFALIVVWQWGRKLKKPRTVHQIERRPAVRSAYGRARSRRPLTTRPRIRRDAQRGW